MTLTVSKLLLLVACIIFAVGFGVLMWGNPGPKFVDEDILLGLAFWLGGLAAP